MLITAGSAVSSGVLLISRNNVSSYLTLFPLTVEWSGLSKAEAMSETQAGSFPPAAADFFDSHCNLLLLLIRCITSFLLLLSFFCNMSRIFHHTAEDDNFLQIKSLTIQKASALYSCISEAKRRIDVILFLSHPSGCSTLSLAAPAWISNVSSGLCFSNVLEQT